MSGIQIHEHDLARFLPPPLNCSVPAEQLLIELGQPGMAFQLEEGVDLQEIGQLLRRRADAEGVAVSAAAESYYQLAIPERGCPFVE